MKLKKIIKTIFPNEETKRKSIEENLGKTINEIVKEKKLEKPDEYFLNRLTKQYKTLIRKAGKYGINTQNYTNKLVPSLK